MRQIPRWSQLRIGAAVTASLVAAVLLIFFVDRLGYWAEYRYRLWVYAESARNLTAGSPVWLAGVPVGRVWAIRFRGPETPVDRRISIELRLRRHVQPLVTHGSTVRVITAGTLGETVVNITPPAEDAPPVADRSALIAGAPIDVPEVVARFQEVRTLLPEVAERFAALRARALQAPPWGDLLSDGGEGPWTRLRQDLLAARAKLASKEGSLARLASDPQLLADLARVTRQLKRVADAAAGEQGTLGRLRRDTVLGPTLKSAAARAARLREQIERGDGTAGRLLYDRELWIQWERARRAWANLRRRAAESGERPR